MDRSGVANRRPSHGYGGEFVRIRRGRDRQRSAAIDCSLNKHLSLTGLARPDDRPGYTVATAGMGMHYLGSHAHLPGDRALPANRHVPVSAWMNEDAPRRNRDGAVEECGCLAATVGADEWGASHFPQPRHAATPVTVVSVSKSCGKNTRVVLAGPATSPAQVSRVRPLAIPAVRTAITAHSVNVFMRIPS